ncbi:TcmI family type II polyketide cyclase [Micromonospora sp. NPDC049559]|uniref:TcmI family type II polyketide cyclase n=1 Tax=Micromonospora sp. NPDC049559 TaxID=3155923 RepID=UPI00343F4050
MNRLVIVAKVLPDAEEQVAQIFAESDRTELPAIVGVRHRSLYRLDDLYVHLVETEDAAADALENARRHPEFVRISQRLRPYVSPYLPTWQVPSDAMAHCFYRWDAPVTATGSPR